MATIEPVTNEVKKTSISKLKTLLFKIFIVLFVVFVLVLLVFTIAEVRNNKEKEIIKDLYGDWAKWKYLYESVNYKSLLLKEKKDKKVSDLIYLYLFGPMALISLSTIAIYYKYSKTVRAEHEKDNLKVDNKMLEEGKTKVIEKLAAQNEVLKMASSELQEKFLENVEKKVKENEKKFKLKYMLDTIPLTDEIKKKLEQKKKEKKEMIEKIEKEEKEKIKQKFITEVQNNAVIKKGEVELNNNEKEQIIKEIINNNENDPFTNMEILKNTYNIEINTETQKQINTFQEQHLDIEYKSNELKNAFDEKINIELINKSFEELKIESTELNTAFEENKEKLTELTNDDSLKSIFDEEKIKLLQQESTNDTNITENKNIFDDKVEKNITTEVLKEEVKLLDKNIKLIINTKNLKNIAKLTEAINRKEILLENAKKGFINFSNDYQINLNIVQEKIKQINEKIKTLKQSGQTEASKFFNKIFSLDIIREVDEKGVSYHYTSLQKKNLDKLYEELKGENLKLFNLSDTDRNVELMRQRLAIEENKIHAMKEALKNLVEKKSKRSKKNPNQHNKPKPPPHPK